MIADHPVLSLAELEQHDPRPTGHSVERRFLCPFPACADHQRREHKNLAANIESGLWECKRCGASGKLTEKWERPQPRARALRVGPYEKARRAMGLVSAQVGGSHQSRAGAGMQRSTVARPPADATTDQDTHVAADTREAVPTWRRRWDQAVPVAGTPGEAYLASRGIPIDTASADRRAVPRPVGALDQRRERRVAPRGDRRVVFPIVDKVGELIGIQGRKIANSEPGEKMLTNGRGGIFVVGTAWPLGEVECVAIVEAPIDALSLATAGIPALATQGTSWPDWLPLALAFKSVLLGHDNDEPDGNGLRAGDLAAAGLVPALRSYGAEPERWRPKAKDWNQDLQELGLDRLRRILAGESVSELEPAAVEIAIPMAQSDSPSELTPVVPELPSGFPVEAYPGAASVEQSERAEVDELLRWLSAADLPHEPFKLRPWVRVADVARFVETLQTELSSHVTSPRWRGAAEDLRQVARLYRGVPGEEQQSRAPPGSHSPSMSNARTGTEELVARRVLGDGGRVG